MARIVILGAGESGAGAAVLAQKKGFDTFVSDMSLIKDKYKAMLNERGIQWEEGKHTEELILNADEVKECKDRKSTRLNSSHGYGSRMPSSA